MGKIIVGKKETVESDPVKEIKRQIEFLEGSDFKTVNPVKYASRMAELEAKLTHLT